VAAADTTYPRLRNDIFTPSQRQHSPLSTRFDSLVTFP
jgi:hypothetical protein